MARVEFACVSRVRDASARFCRGSVAILAGLGTTASKSAQKRTNAPTTRDVLICTDDRLRKLDLELGIDNLSANFSSLFLRSRGERRASGKTTVVLPSH